MSRQPQNLTVAITGATGTLGPPLLARLAGERAVTKILVIGRQRPADMPRKAEFRAADMRDRAATTRAIDTADVVIHTAFALYGVASSEAELFATNVEGTLNAARAAALTGASRFVYTSSAIVYGMHPDPDPITEDAPLRASGHHFYARHKAQAELLIREALDPTDTEAYLFRPCAIVGPHALGGATSRVPNPIVRAATRVRPAAPPPPVPLQFVHEDDVAQALVRAALGEGPPGAYNLAGTGALEGDDVLKTAGLRKLPAPRALLRAAARALTKAPPVLPALGWAEVLSEPLLLDTTKARRELGWRPRYSSRAALAHTREALGW